MGVNHRQWLIRICHKGGGRMEGRDIGECTGDDTEEEKWTR